MGYVFPEDVIQEVKAASDIFQIISEYVPLKKSGQSFKGLCPFHSEKTPSFFVHQDKQIYHCFGCGNGGNVFSFLMQYENIPFPEAVRQLAERGGVRLPALKQRDSREEGLIRKILEANREAMAFFSAQLKGEGGRKARAYLEERGVDSEGVESFQLGWSPDGWENLREHLGKKGFTAEVLEKAGLIIPRRGGGGHYDRFRSRIIFPIINEKGEVVAFGGRILDEGEPKYMNSPETPVYQKSRVLYGLNVAKGKIREAGSAVVVEGYTDLISAHMAGVSNTVATLGTALTRRHIRLLKRYTAKVVVVYDADSAGTEAAKRSLETFLEEDLMGHRAALPEGHDPDSLIREKGPEALIEALKASIPLADFFIQETESRWRGEGIEGKTRAVAEVVPILARMKSRVQQSEYIRRVSQVMDVREEAAAAELKRYLRGTKRSPEAAPPVRKVARSRVSGEEELVRAMLMDGDLAARIKNEFPLGEFRDEASRAVAAAIYSLLDDGQEVDPAQNLNLADPGAAALAARLLAEEDMAVQMEKKVNDCLLSFKQARLGEELREIQAKIRKAEEADNSEVINELLRIKQKIRQNMMSLQSASN